MKSNIKLFLIALGAAFVGGVGAVKFSQHADSKSSIDRAQSSAVRYVNNMPAAGDMDFTAAAEHTVPGVVHVKTIYGDNQNVNYFNPFEDLFFGNPHRGMQREMASTGSGVIISDDGYIVTNNHVVANGEKIEITLNNNEKFEAKVIGTDPSTDLALVKIESKGLPYIPYGNSDDVKIGQWVLAVGNPMELNSTVTAGIVSAKARNINIIQGGTAPIESFIQTDAAVNPGNSGGALVNTRGELVGINTAIASNTGSYSGYSFAVPVNIVRKVVNDFMEYGNVQRAFLGIVSKEINADLAKEKNLDEVKGVYIQGTSEDGGAAEAGLKPGDVVLKIDGREINSTATLLETVGSHRPGDKVKVDYLRNGDLKETMVTLKNKMGTTTVIKNESFEMLGATFSPVEQSDLKRLGVSSGVKISTLAAGKLRSAGIKEGFIITGIDRQPISGTSDVQAILNEKKGGVLIEGVYPNGLRAWYGVGLDD